MIRVSTFILVISAVIYLLMMFIIVKWVDDFFLRMYAQIGAGSLYVFHSAIGLIGRYNGLDEAAREIVARERREREQEKRWKAIREEEQKK